MAHINTELLVTKGLFPENLPPVYTTRHIWAALSPEITAYSIIGKAVGDLCVYNSSKRGGQRRLFGIPHPLFIKDQGLFFNKHWPELQVLFERAPGSVSRPIVDEAGVRYVRITPHQELPKLRLTTLARFKYCLITDVSRFYPSVYTHTFPWAINGKATAKLDTNPYSAAAFGNRLDFIIRQAQSKQTIGIPVGPDASKIAAEILLSAVDSRFVELSGRSRPVYIRHVDDYWVGADSYDECEKHLQTLRLALREFELDINEAKTRIVSTKYVFGGSWPSEFEKELKDSLGWNAKGTGLDPIATFGKIIDRAIRDNDDGIIKHALRVIDDHHLWSPNWDILEHLLTQCAIQFPHSFDYVARVIAWRRRIGAPINESLWKDVTLLTATQSGGLGRDSEVVWAIWLLKELKQRIPKALSDILLAESGGFVLSFLAHFPKHRLANDRDLFTRLRDLVEGDPFSGRYWPLTLELTHLAQGDATWNASPTLPVLRCLHEAKISIIDWNALPKVFLEPRENENADPDYAIEDYGSDYGDDSEEEDEEPGAPAIPDIDLAF